MSRGAHTFLYFGYFPSLGVPWKTWFARNVAGERGFYSREYRDQVDVPLWRGRIVKVAEYANVQGGTSYVAVKIVDATVEAEDVHVVVAWRDVGTPLQSHHCQLRHFLGKHCKMSPVSEMSTRLQFQFWYITCK